MINSVNQLLMSKFIIGKKYIIMVEFIINKINHWKAHTTNCTKVPMSWASTTPKARSRAIPRIF